MQHLRTTARPNLQAIAEKRAGSPEDQRFKTQALADTPDHSGTSDKHGDEQATSPRPGGVQPARTCGRSKRIESYQRHMPPTSAGIAGPPVNARTAACSVHPAEDPHVPAPGFRLRRIRRRQAKSRRNSFGLLARSILSGPSDNSGARQTESLGPGTPRRKSSDRRSQLIRPQQRYKSSQ
jgi:hypothetical protein